MAQASPARVQSRLYLFQPAHNCIYSTVAEHSDEPTPVAWGRPITLKDLLGFR